MIFSKRLFKFIVQVIAVWLIVFGYYYSVSNGLGDKPFYLQLRRFVPCALAIMVPCYLVKENLFSWKNFSALFIGFIWILTYPVLYWVTYKSTVPFFSNHFDIAIGLYLISFLTSVQFLALRVIKKRKIFSYSISFIELLVCLLPLLQWVYFFIYRTCVSEMALVAIYQTNMNEILEFFKTVGLAPIVLFAGLVIGFYSMLVHFNNKQIDVFSNNAIKRKKATAVLLLLIAVATGGYLDEAYKYTRLIEHYGEVKEYFESAKLFAANREKKLLNLSVQADKPLWNKPGTVILVIGESASRNYMSAYSNVEHDTTPWLRSKKQDKNFILFKNVYSPIANTVKVLEMALTNKNQYNNIQFSEAISIIDIAKKAGYKTFWYSNQGTVGSADTQTTLIANTCDVAQWTNQSLGKEQYDEALLEYLGQVDANEKNFVVLHIMGSHDNFQNRYPPTFTKWGDPQTYDFPVNYDNSLLYTDYVLSKIFDYAEKNLNLETMVYFSDHGQNPHNLRHPDAYGFAWLRVPMFVYVSPNYQKQYPKIYHELEKQRDTYYTNDLLFDTLIGMLNVKSNYYDASNSLTSPDYKWRRETLKVRLGKAPLTDDKTDD